MSPTPPPLNEFGAFQTGKGQCGSDGPCVEAAVTADGQWYALRDTKLGTDSPVLTFTADEMAVFSAGLTAGTFTHTPS